MKSLPFATAWMLGTLAIAAEFHHPSGFRVNLPSGWQATRTDKGHIVFASPNPLEYAFVQPVPARTADCAATLRQTLLASVTTDVRIQPAGKGLAMAQFSMQNGQSRGSILCAETSRSSGMFYGLSAPRAEFDRELPKLVSVLKSFAFESAASAGAPKNVPIPPLQAWQEPNEGAYTMQIPQNWRTFGGITRQGILIGFRSGVQLVSPDGASLIRIGDQRLKDCMIPGPSAQSLPGIQQQFADGTLCWDQSGLQFGQRYLQILARDLGLTGVTVTARSDRQDLAQLARTGLAATQLNVRTLFGEIGFRATRAGQPVAGSIFAKTSLLPTPGAQDLSRGMLSFEITAFCGPDNSFDTLGVLTSAVASSVRVNPDWYMKEQQVTRQAGQQVVAALNASAERQQKAFWERSAAAEARSQSVGHLLRGTVEVSDGKGNTYEAKAGSNYYFRDDELARRVSRPDQAILRTDTWPSNTVDLTPLEVMR